MGERNLYAIAAAGNTHPCACIGPQNGEPRCPCMMRSVIERDGRWIERERDLGPARPVFTPPQPAEPIGCICPPTSEQTCQRPTCPRRGIRSSLSPSSKGEQPDV